MTNRQTFHDGERKRQMPTPSRFGNINGYDSCRVSAGNCLVAGGGGHAK